MTKRLGYQKEIFSKEEASSYFKESNLIDCRINAFPSYTEYNGIQRYPPDFIFIDIDRADFKTEKGLNLALSRTLGNIKEKFVDSSSNVDPTVLKTGGGYHIYQPLESFVLEEIKFFTDLTVTSSSDFLKFAKNYLSNGKADKNSNPSFKSSLLRIPYSINSKYNNKITIIQRWNGYRPSIKHLLLDFETWLIDRKIKEERKLKKLEEKRGKTVQNNNAGFILWIEKLLQTPIDDYRKNAISLILSTYLVNIKKKSYEESFNIIKDWLDRCDNLQRIDFNVHTLLKYSLDTALKNRIPPMRLETLKEKNSKLYNDIVKK